MSSQELFPELDGLSREEKLRAMQYLVISLAREDKIELPTYEVWVPMVSDETIEAMMQFKRERQAARGHATDG